jgi:hypothetical protein
MNTGDPSRADGHSICVAIGPKGYGSETNGVVNRIIHTQNVRAEAGPAKSR